MHNKAAPCTIVKPFIYGSPMMRAGQGLSRVTYIYHIGERDIIWNSERTTVDLLYELAWVIAAGVLEVPKECQ